jgi:glycosyltransferase involved in cell wall biosynthesis
MTTQQAKSVSSSGMPRVEYHRPKEMQPASTGLRPLRVLFVTARYFPFTGGTETHVFEVARRLANVGVDITILTTDPGRRLPPAEHLNDVQVRRVRAWPAKEDYYFAPAIYRIIVEGDWDIVHCHSYHTFVAPLAMLAAWRSNTPFVVTFHSGAHSSRLRKLILEVQRKMLRPLLARAERLICVSLYEAEFLRKRLHLPAERFVIIPSGSDLPLSAPPMQAITNSRLIVSVGRLEPYKGHHRVIAALPKVVEQYPDVRLRIVGSGPYKSALRRLAQDLGVADRVEIAPIPAADRHAMASILLEAALVTQLSDHESQGIAVLEALSLKRPVLVTDTAALHELAACGLVRAIPLKSTAEEVAVAMLDQLRDPLIPTNVDLPTWDACAAELFALYHTVLSCS